MMDPDCATCDSINELLKHLNKICTHIDMACMGKRKKEDFGLKKVFIKEQIIPNIKSLKKFHEYYHATGHGFGEANSVIDSPIRFPKPRRWRPSK